MKGKHLAGLALIIVLLMIAGCVKQPIPVETQEKTVVEDTGKIKEIVDDEKSKPENEEMMDMENEIEEKSEEMNSESNNVMEASLKKLLDKGANHDEYIFKYAKSPYLTRIHTIIIKGNKIKNILPGEDIYKKHELYTVVYLDTSDKSAIGYCEDERKCPDMKKEFPVAYETHYITTPVDWVKSIEYAEEVGGENLYGRDAIIIEFEKNGKVHRASIDSFYGLPLQITQNVGTMDEITETYEIIKAGRINENEVMRLPVFE